MDHVIGTPMRVKARKVRAIVQDKAVDNVQVVVTIDGKPVAVRVSKRRLLKALTGKQLTVTLQNVWGALVVGDE